MKDSLTLLQVNFLATERGAVLRFPVVSLTADRDEEKFVTFAGEKRTCRAWQKVENFANMWRVGSREL